MAAAPRPRRCFSCLLLAGLLAWGSGAAALEPAAIFTDHMVLQRDRPIALFGQAAPGAVIDATLAGQQGSAMADAAGAWRLTLPPLPAGGPHRLTLASDADAGVTLEDVLIGDLWLASGQSNMAMRLDDGVDDGPALIAGAERPLLRYFKVANTVAPAPRADLPGGPWQRSTPRTAAGFSAVAYSFALELQESQSVPIGIIEASWGGTPAEAWTSGASLAGFPAFAPTLAAREPERFAAARAEEQRLWKLRNAVLEGGDEAPRAPDYDDRAWPQLELPAAWPKTPIGWFDGVVWLRKTVELPPDLAGRALELELGRIHHQAIVYVNGAEVGRSEGGRSRFAVPEGLTRPGANLIAVRAIDLEWGAGGVGGPAERLRLAGADGSVIPLAGAWRYNHQLGPALPTHVRRLQHQPAVLFNAMIAPLAGLPLRGVIWYQGEANVERADQYRALFPALIEDWRQHWGDPALPFLFVQLANYRQRRDQPVDEDWARLREAQAAALDLPATAMAVAIDIGAANDIHPRNKRAVGHRLALAAQAVSYGAEFPHRGPRLVGQERVGNRLVLHFDDEGAGLQALPDGRLRGFAIAGPAREFHWADARLTGEGVELYHPLVENPVAARYGWANNPEVSLYNRSGLPAAPFRTDSWPKPPEG